MQFEYGEGMANIINGLGQYKVQYNNNNNSGGQSTSTGANGCNSSEQTKKNDEDQSM